MIVITDCLEPYLMSKEGCHRWKLLKKFFYSEKQNKSLYFIGSFVIVYRSHFMFILIFLNTYFSNRMKDLCCSVQS